MWPTVITATTRQHWPHHSSSWKYILGKRKCETLTYEILAKSPSYVKCTSLFTMQNALACWSLVSIYLMFPCTFVFLCRWQQSTGSRVSRTITSSSHWSAPKLWDTWGNDLNERQDNLTLPPEHTLCMFSFHKNNTCVTDPLDSHPPERWTEEMWALESLETAAFSLSCFPVMNLEKELTAASIKSV